MVVAVLAILLGIALRCHAPGRAIFWNDETWTSVWLTGLTWPEFVATMPADTTTAGALVAALDGPPRKAAIATVAAIAHEDPKQPALYMLLVRLWADLFGRSPAALRGFSVLLGILGLGAMFLFLREWRADTRTAWIGTALLALSPWQLLYAHEARPYTLWVLMILVSNGLLLRARRTARRPDWLAYAASLAAGLFSHTFFALTIAAQALWMSHPRTRSRGDHRAWRGAALLGVAAWLPWGVLLVLKFEQLLGNTGWVIRTVGLPALVKRWILALASPFVDSGSVAANAAPLVLVAAVACLALVLLALVTMAREDPDGALLTAAPIVVTALLLMLPDIVLGGGKMSTARFLAPLLLAETMAVAWYLGTRRTPASRAKLAFVAFVALLLIGGASGIVIDRTTGPWTKYAEANLDTAARVIATQPRPLVVGRNDGPDLRRTLSLARRLPADIPVILLPAGSRVSAPPGRATFFSGTAAPFTDDGVIAEPVTESAWRLVTAPAGR
jgi:uncharacterized membrane protein